jgi:hypothetical protein
MNRSELKKFTSWLGKRSYAARIESLGIERIREIARENGRLGGRPKKQSTKSGYMKAKREGSHER